MNGKKHHGFARFLPKLAPTKLAPRLPQAQHPQGETHNGLSYPISSPVEHVHHPPIKNPLSSTGLFGRWRMFPGRSQVAVGECVLHPSFSTPRTRGQSNNSWGKRTHGRDHDLDMSAQRHSHCAGTASRLPEPSEGDKKNPFVG